MNYQQQPHPRSQPLSDTDRIRAFGGASSERLQRVRMQILEGMSKRMR